MHERLTETENLAKERFSLLGTSTKEAALFLLLTGCRRFELSEKENITATNMNSSRGNTSISTWGFPSFLSSARVGISDEEEPVNKAKSNSNSNDSALQEVSIFQFDNPLRSFFGTTDNHTVDPIKPQLTKERPFKSHPVELSSSQESQLLSPLQPSSLSVKGSNVVAQEAVRLHIIGIKTEPQLEGENEVGQEGVELVFPSLDSAESEDTGETDTTELETEQEQAGIELVLPSLEVDDSNVIGESDAVEIQIMISEEVQTSSQEEEAPLSQLEEQGSLTIICDQSSEHTHKNSEKDSIDSGHCEAQRRLTIATAPLSPQLTLPESPSQVATTAHVSPCGSSNTHSSESPDQTEFLALQAMILQYEGGMANDDEERSRMGEEGLELELTNKTQIFDLRKTTSNDLENLQKQQPTLSVDEQALEESSQTAILVVTDSGFLEKEHIEECTDAKGLSLNSPHSQSVDEGETQFARLPNWVQQYEEDGDSDEGSKTKESQQAPLSNLQEDEASQGSLSQEPGDEEFMALQAMIAGYEKEQSNGDSPRSNDAEYEESLDLQETEHLELAQMRSGEQSTQSSSDDDYCTSGLDASCQEDEKLLELLSMIENYENENSKTEELYESHTVSDAHKITKTLEATEVNGERAELSAKIEEEILQPEALIYQDEISIETEDSGNDSKEILNIAGMNAGERNLLLIRELRHIQLRGPDMFDSIDEKIASWKKEEAQRLSQPTHTLSRATRSSNPSKNGVDQGTPLLEAKAREKQYALQYSKRPALKKDKSRNLIHELEFVQMQGPDIFDAIDDKVKTWQRQESVRQLQCDTTLQTVIDCGENRGRNLAALDENCKTQQNTMPVSEATESTHSCSSSCSASLIISETRESNLQWTTIAEEIQDHGHQAKSYCPLEWEAPAHMSALVDKVLSASPAVLPPECSDMTSEFDEVTVYSDDEEWTILDSVEDQAEVYEFFDFDNLDVEDNGNEYGVIGQGVSDNVSVLSELTTQTVDSTHLKEFLPAPTLVLRSVAGQPILKSTGQTLLPLSPRELRKVPVSPRKVTRQHKLSFQQVRLKRARSNPSRLPQMRQAALLVLLRGQPRPVGIHDKSLEKQDPQSVFRQVRRCFSEKREHGNVVSEIPFEQGKPLSRSPVEQVGGASNCILDFSWDELDNLEGQKNTLQPNGSGNLSNETTVLPEAATPLPPGAKQIGKTDNFYDSVSISFLALSIRDQTIVQVMDEALRILHQGGILHVLDKNGSVIERIQQNPKYQALSFQRTSTMNRARVETNTATILKKCGLHTKFQVTDPRIIHWTATKD